MAFYILLFGLKCNPHGYDVYNDKVSCIAKGNPLDYYDYFDMKASSAANNVVTQY